MISLAQYQLEPELRDRFAKQVRSEAARVRENVRRAEIGQPLCSVAFLYTYEDEAVVSYAYALTESHRQLCMKTRGEHGIVWRPADWDCDLEGPGSLNASSDIYREAAALADVLRDRGLDDPARPFLEDVCRRLIGEAWDDTAMVTDDFAVWCADHELDERSIATFRELAPSAAVRAYRDRGWLSLDLLR